MTFLSFFFCFPFLVLGTAELVDLPLKGESDNDEEDTERIPALADAYKGKVVLNCGK